MAKRLNPNYKVELYVEPTRPEFLKTILKGRRPQREYPSTEEEVQEYLESTDSEFRNEFEPAFQKNLLHIREKEKKAQKAFRTKAKRTPTTGVGKGGKRPKKNDADENEADEDEVDGNEVDERPAKRPRRRS